MYSYLHKKNNLNYRYRNRLQSLIHSTENLSCLEIGIGNALSSIPLSEMFKTYTGIEPDPKLFQLSQENCQVHSCRIRLLHQSFTDFVPDQNYDVITMFNVSFLLKPKLFEHYLQKMASILSQNGIIYIQNPSIHSNRWGDARLNKNSPEYNKELRRNRQAQLKHVRRIIKRFCQDHHLTYARKRFIDGDDANDATVYVLAKHN